jgi:hypothetical protein
MFNYLIEYGNDVKRALSGEYAMRLPHSTPRRTQLRSLRYSLVGVGHRTRPG